MVSKEEADKKINQQEFKSGNEDVGQLLKVKLVLQNINMGLIRIGTEKRMQQFGQYLILQ